jgi:hypothetical protein
MATASIFNDTAEFASTFLYILDDCKRLVHLNPKPTQIDYLNNRTGRDLILKARQLGFTTIIQADLFRKAITSTVATMTLSHENKTTQAFRRMVDRFYENWPVAVKPQRNYSNATVATYPDYDSEAMIATAGNVQTGRGATLTDVHGSEVAYWKDAESIVAGVLQAGKPNVVLESTANGAQGYFFNLVMEALDGNSDWRLHFYPWWYEPTYRKPLRDNEQLNYTDDELELMVQQGLDVEQINWRRSKQHELKHLFLQEYPEDPYSCFLASGNSYFGDVSHAMIAPMDAKPEDSARYVAGLDFAQTVDYTVMIVLDRATCRMVDMLRINKLSWGEQRRQIAERAHKWNNCDVWAESNSIGKPNIEELRNAGVSIYEFATTAKSKPPLIQGLHHALHEGGLTIWNVDTLRHELHAFISKQMPSGAWQYAAQDGAHDDTVIALALAWHGHNYSSIGISFS